MIGIVCILLVVTIDSAGTLVPFPLHEFLDSNDEVLVSGYEKHLCKGSFSNSDNGCCSCSIDCMKHRSCCIDIFWSTYESPLTDYIDYFIEESSKFKKQSCVEAFPDAQKEGAISESYIMVSQCESNATKEQKDLCAGDSALLKSRLPVLGIDGYLYKNIHCTICNTAEEIEMPEINLNCEDLRKNCSYFYQSDKLEKCRSYKGCNNTKSKYYNLCNSFIGPVDKYRNYFCWLCSEESSRINPSAVFCTEGSDPSGSLVSWSSLLRFSDDTAARNEGCDGATLRHLVSGQCVSFRCPPGYNVKGSKCVSKDRLPQENIKSLGGSFESCLKKSRLYAYIINETKNAASIAIDFLMAFNMDELFERRNHAETYIYKTKRAISSDRIMDDVFSPVNILPYSLTTRSSKVIFSPYDIPYELLKKSDYSKLFPLNRQCASLIPLDVEKVQFKKNCDVMYMGETINNENISIWLEFTKQTARDQNKVFTCKNFYETRPCLLRVLSSHTSILKNKTLVHKDKSKTEVYATNNYLPLSNGTYGVCFNPEEFELTKQLDWYTQLHIIEGYVSFTGSVLSFVCYIILIMTIVMYKEIQNIAGLCILALCTCLFVGDTLFLVTNILTQLDIDVNKNMCELIAILNHLSLLASQIWGVLLAGDAMSNVTSLQRRRDKKDVLKNYATICFLITSAIVFTAVMLKEYDVLDISYGKNGVCFLHGFYGRILFYFTPLLTSFVTSTIYLALLVHRISNHVANSRAVLENNRQQINTTKVALKLIVICGISEGIGLINVGHSNLSENELVVNSVFGVLYSISKSCRGVVLLIVFIGRKGVVDFYKIKLQALGIISIKRSETELETMPS